MSQIFKNVEVNQTGGVGEILLNRPETLNAFTLGLHEELRLAFQEVGARPNIRAIVFGARGKTFSAGGDFDELMKSHADAGERRHAIGHARPLLMAIATCRVPVIAAVQGHAVGLGTTVMLCSDIVVCSRNVQISDPHVMIGLAAGDGGCVLWPQSAGLLRAKRYLLTGDRLNAADAHAIGLVTDLVESPEDVLPAAHAIGARIAALPPLAVQATKRILNQGLQHRIDEVLDFGLALEAETMATKDLAAAVAAVRGRRAGSFNGE